MKRWMPFLLSLILLAGCQTLGANPTEGAPVAGRVSHDTPVSTGDAATPADDAVVTTGTIFRVNGNCYLTADSLYSLSDDSFADGEVVAVSHDGMILETYPASFANIQSIDSIGMEYNRIGLLQQVISDLMETDPALNDAIQMLTFDFSSANLTTSEVQALTYWAWCEYGVDVFEATMESLTAEGRIDPNDGFTDGLHITLETFDDTGDSLGFHIQKYRGPLGAYYFHNCTAKADKDRNYSYSIGEHMVS